MGSFNLKRTGRSGQHRHLVVDVKKTGQRVDMGEYIDITATLPLLLRGGALRYRSQHQQSSRHSHINASLVLPRLCRLCRLSPQQLSIHQHSLSTCVSPSSLPSSLWQPLPPSSLLSPPPLSTTPSPLLPTPLSNLEPSPRLNGTPINALQSLEPTPPLASVSFRSNTTLDVCV